MHVCMWSLVKTRIVYVRRGLHLMWTALVWHLLTCCGTTIVKWNYQNTYVSAVAVKCTTEANSCGRHTRHALKSPITSDHVVVGAVTTIHHLSAVHKSGKSLWACLSNASHTGVNSTMRSVVMMSSQGRCVSRSRWSKWTEWTSASPLRAFCGWHHGREWRISLQ